MHVRQEKASVVMYVKHAGMLVPSVAGESDGGDDLFFTEILILSKYSENISAHAQRINTSQLQCKTVCLLF